MRGILPNLDVLLLHGNKVLMRDYQLLISDNQLYFSGYLSKFSSSYLCTHLLLLPEPSQPVSFHTPSSHKHQTYLLPIKAAIRVKEMLQVDMVVHATLWI
jgi:hypothetical protein